MVHSSRILIASKNETFLCVKLIVTDTEHSNWNSISTLRVKLKRSLHAYLLVGTLFTREGEMFHWIAQFLWKVWLYLSFKRQKRQLRKTHHRHGNHKSLEIPHFSCFLELWNFKVKYYSCPLNRLELFSTVIYSHFIKRVWLVTERIQLSFSLPFLKQ